MKFRCRSCLVLSIVLVSGAATSNAQPEDPRFRVDLLPFDLPEDTPRLQSYSHAVGSTMGNDGKWLILGGFTKGVHGCRHGCFFAPPPPEDGSADFPGADRNGMIYVIDPEDANSVCMSPLPDDLPPPVFDALRSVAQESVQIDDTEDNILWILGGFGQSDLHTTWVTFGYLIAVDVEGLIGAISKSCPNPAPNLSRFFSWGAVEGCEAFVVPEDLDDCPRWMEDCDLTVTGGGMEVIDGELYIVLGQRFAGKYSDGQDRCQNYQCRVVSLAPPELNFGGEFEILHEAITLVGASSDLEGCQYGEQKSTDPFHRRDLNVTPAMWLDDSGPMEAIYVLGGVFKNDTTGFVQPMYVDADGVTLDEDPDHAQILCQYDTARVELFDERDGTMYNLLLGGISTVFCTGGERGEPCTGTRRSNVTPAFIRDGLLISSQGGRNTVGFYGGAHSMSQIPLSDVFPVDPASGKRAVFLGASADFILAKGTPTYSNGVIQLHELGGPMVVGYVFGGIESHGPALQPDLRFVNPFFGSLDSTSEASKRAFAVMITPSQ